MSSPEADRQRVRTVPIGLRTNKVNPALLATPPGTDRDFDSFLASLPGVLAARDLRLVIDRTRTAHAKGAGVVLLLGGHVIKVGLGLLIGRLIDLGAVTHIAMNGAAAIHDFELAAYGGTSEDVESGLADGTFGMAEETGRDMNAAINSAHARQIGLGQGLGEALLAMTTLPGGDVSILARATRHGVPVTVHTAIGAEIIHQHPSADGAAIGATSLRDFDRLAGSLPRLDQGGVVMNWGSAVIMPEVFLKALTVARNLHNGKPTGFLAADFDMIKHYRPAMNVVRRPTRGHGEGVQITGHHEILMPLVVWGVAGSK